MMQDRKTFRLSKSSVLKLIGDYLRACLETEKVYLISITEETSGKTHAQLRAIFGRWAKEVSERTGYTVDEIHKEWKRLFLCRIYAENPHGKHQQAWVDMLYHLTDKDDWEGVQLHAKEISLSWSTVKQAKEYMERIEHHYISAGIPLPPIDRNEIK